MSCVEVHYSNR